METAPKSFHLSMFPAFGLEVSGVFYMDIKQANWLVRQGHRP